MSRTLSKVLIICALVVVLPLMIAGTAMAAYYSINATVSIEIFVDKTIDGATAEVSYKNNVGKVDKALKITDGHLKKVTFKTYAVGYDFVGWYAGTYEAYAKELEQGKTMETIKYAVETPEANVEMTEFQNLVAVFKAKRFTVSYKYFQKPNGLGGVEVNEVPTSKNGLIVDGKEAPETAPEPTQTEEFVFGDALHTLEYEGHPEYTFDGWYLGDDTTTKYTTANFADSENIVLTGKWIDSKRINLTYLDANGNELEKVTTESRNPVYANRKYTLKTVEDFKTELEAAGYEFKAGYTYGWQDVSTSSIVTEINSENDVVVQISRSAITYKAKIDFADSGLSLDNQIAQELTFSVDTKNALNIWNVKENWKGAHAFWSFDHLTYNDAKVENLETLLGQVIDANPNETTEITLKAVKAVAIDKVKISVDFASDPDGVAGSEGYVGDVYKGSSKLEPRVVTLENFDVLLNVAFDLMTGEGENKTLANFYKSADNTTGEIYLEKLLFSDNDSATTNVVDGMDINALIDFLYSIDKNITSKITVEGEGDEAKNVLTFKLTLCFGEKNLENV